MSWIFQSKNLFKKLEFKEKNEKFRYLYKSEIEEDKVIGNRRVLNNGIMRGKAIEIEAKAVIILVGRAMVNFERYKLKREIRIDYHKVQEHVEIEIDITFFKAHCELLSLDYTDILGQGATQLPIKKRQVDAEQKQVSKEYKDLQLKVNDLAEDVRKYPGCNVVGKLNKAFKADSTISIGFKEKRNYYFGLRKIQDLDINLDYKLNSLIIGGEKNYEAVVEYLFPFHPYILEEMNPAATDEGHRSGAFATQIDMHVFPVEYKSDYNGALVESYQFSYAKNFEILASDGHKVPSMDIRFQFLPLKQVYHVKEQYLWNEILNLLTIFGGILGVVEVINYFIR